VHLQNKKKRKKGKKKCETKKKKKKKKKKKYPPKKKKKKKTSHDALKTSKKHEKARIKKQKKPRKRIKKYAPLKLVLVAHSCDRRDRLDDGRLAVRDVPNRANVDRRLPRHDLGRQRRQRGVVQHHRLQDPHKIILVKKMPRFRAVAAVQKSQWENEN
jgi:hypothetical protein